MNKLPEEISIEGAELLIRIGSDKDDATTSRLVVFEGNRKAFYCLANLLMYYGASLHECIDLKKIPFISMKGIGSFIINIEDTMPFGCDEITIDDRSCIIWKISSERMLQLAASSIQPLGYKTEDHELYHVHLDENKCNSELSILYKIS